MNEYSVLNQIKIYYSRSIIAESEEDANGKNLMLNNFITHELVKYFSEKFPPGGTGTYSIYSQQIGEVDKRC